MEQQKKFLPIVYGESLRPKNEVFNGASLFFVVSVILLYVGISYFHQRGQLSDEGFHQPLINHIMAHGFNNLPKHVTTPPYFHAVIAYLTKISGITQNHLEFMRFLQLLMCIGAIPCFYFICAQLRKVDCDVRMLTCLLLPNFLPLMNLIYTDPPAITFTMAMILCMLKGWHWLAAFCAILGLGIRQLTIIWACFCAVYTIFSYLDAYRHQQPLRNFLGDFRSQRKLVLTVIPYLLPAVAFVAYVLYNRGIVAGDVQSHPMSVNFTNFFHFLIFSFFIFLPFNIEKAPEIVQLIKKHWWTWAFIPLLLIAYFAVYKITHGYNHQNNYWWLHNQLLAISTLKPINKLLFFIPVIWMTMTYYLCAIQSEKPWQLFLIYFFGALSFIPLPMVEWRYYLMTLLLFILWKPKFSTTSERIVLYGFLVLAFYVIYGQARRIFFL